MITVMVTPFHMMVTIKPIISFCRFFTYLTPFLPDADRPTRLLSLRRCSFSLSSLTCEHFLRPRRVLNH